MFLNRSGFEVFPETRKRKGDAGTEKEVARAASMRMDEVDDGLYNHAGNMLECMKSRKRPACDIEDGLHSSATCLLGVVALRTRERIEFDPVKLELKDGSGAAKKLFGREYRAPGSSRNRASGATASGTRTNDPGRVAPVLASSPGGGAL